MRTKWCCKGSQETFRNARKTLASGEKETHLHIEDKMEFSKCKSAETVDMESLWSHFTAPLENRTEEKPVIFSAGNIPQGSRNSRKTLRSAETYGACSSRALNSNDPVPLLPSQTQAKILISE